MHDSLLIVVVVNGDDSHFNEGEYFIARETSVVDTTRPWNEDYYTIESDTSGNMKRQGSYFKWRFRVVIDLRDLCFRYNIMVGGIAKTMKEMMK